MGAGEVTIRVGRMSGGGGGGVVNPAREEDTNNLDPFFHSTCTIYLGLGAGSSGFSFYQRIASHRIAGMAFTGQEDLVKLVRLRRYREKTGR